MTKTDVVMLGGGPAGSATALTLLRYSNLQVTMVERGDYGGPRVGETIGPGLQPMLAYLGVWEKFLEDQHRPSRATVAAWGSEQVSHQEFFFTGRGTGWHLDRGRFDRMLSAAVAGAGGCVVTDAGPPAVERWADGTWHVIAGGHDQGRIEIAARFLVDATGRAASLARGAGARVQRIDHLAGAVAFVEGVMPKPEDDDTLVEACSHGWWYSAPLPGPRLVVAFMSDAKILRALGARHAAGWHELLGTAPLTRERMPTGRLASVITVRPASSQRLEFCVGNGWIAVGDAAAAFDPLSSMGIGHALSSGANAARAVHAHLADGDDVELLEQYGRGVADNFTRYLETRRQFYACERRWPDQPFWTRRHLGE